MSVKTMTRVWEFSKQRSSRRFCMIAIADNADDNGESFVGIPRLARKMAVSTRTVQRLIEELSQTDELAVIWRGGKIDQNRSFTNYYYVLTGRPEEEIRKIKAHVAKRNAQDEIAQSIIEAGKRGPEARARKDGDKMSPVNGDKMTPLLEAQNDPKSPGMVTFSSNNGDIAMSPRLLTIKNTDKEIEKESSEILSVNQIWETIADQFKFEMSPRNVRGYANYKQYVQPLIPISFDGNVLVIAAPDENIRGWVETRLGRTIQRLASAQILHDCEVQVIVHAKEAV